jgi:hypothetical protein
LQIIDKYDIIIIMNTEVKCEAVIGLVDRVLDLLNRSSVLLSEVIIPAELLAGYEENDQDPAQGRDGVFEPKDSEGSPVGTLRVGEYRD